MGPLQLYVYGPEIPEFSVNCCPAHTGLGLAEGEGVLGVGLTVIIMVEDVAVVGLAQVAFDVIIQYTVALLVNAEVVYE